MSNVLAKTKRQQIERLVRLGWSLRKIEAATGVHRETISAYHAAAGIPVRRRGGRVADWLRSNPATTAAVSTDSGPPDPGCLGGAVGRDAHTRHDQALGCQ